MQKTKEICNNVINQIKINKWIHYIILIIIGIVLSIGLKEIQIRDTHDGFLHFFRILGTYDTLSLGIFPPLVIQNYCNNSGYAMNLFYPPLVTYIPLLINIFTKSYMLTLKVFGAICIILSGITMYQCTYKITKNKCIAFLTGVFYMIAPYKLATVYKRYAIGEFTALVFMPLVFLGLYNLFNEDGKKHYYIAIGAIGLMLSHTITTVYTAIFCILYVLFYIKKLKNKEILKKCIINVIFILLVSLLFWFPMLEASNSAEYAIMNDKIISTTGKYASEHTISFYQLFFDTQEKNGITFLIGIPTLFAIILTPFVFKKIKTEYKEIYLIFILFSFISLFMTSKFFPWIVMPNILCKLQYPWRMMGFFAFFISFICGINLYTLIKNIIKEDYLKVIIILFFVIISINFTIPTMYRFYTQNPNLDEEYQSAVMAVKKKISHKSINRDYMPIRALLLQDSYVEEREDKTYILQGKAEIIEENKEENLTDNIKIKNVSKDTILEFPYLFYVGYEANLQTENGSIKLQLVESENGYLSCKLQEDIKEGKITVKYVGTTIQYVSYIISAISLIVFICYIIYENKKK